MRPNVSALFPLVLIGFLTALTFWLDMTTRPTEAKAGNDRHDPDYFVENFTVYRFDPTGKLQHTITARHLQHYPDDDTTDVIAPHIVYHRNRPTDITSDTANMDSGGKTVVFNGNVRVVSINPLGLDTEITTSTLTALTDDEIAKTDAPVKITQGLSVIHGTGMHADNKTKIATLYGRTHGTIAPKK